jgi:hypothetical protein
MKRSARPHHNTTPQITLGDSGPDPSAAAPNATEPPRCGWYLPDSASLDRYLWSLQWFAANGYYVLAEFRPAAGDATSRNEEAFVEAWRWLWRAVACLPNFKSDLEGRVFADLLSTPDAAGHRWEAAEGEDGASVPGDTLGSFCGCCVLGLSKEGAHRPCVAVPKPLPDIRPSTHTRNCTKQASLSCT